MPCHPADCDPDCPGPEEDETYSGSDLAAVFCLGVLLGVFVPIVVALVVSAVVG